MTIEKQAGDVTKITVTSQTAFDTGSAEIKPGFRSPMERLADVVVRCQKTAITVVGQTDAEGSAENNRELSRRRANRCVELLVAPVRAD